MTNLKIAALTTLVISICLITAMCSVAPNQECSDVIILGEDGTPDLKGCELRIAVENGYPPFNYIDTSSNVAMGYDYDIFGVICARINCQPVFVETNWDTMLAVMRGEEGFTAFDVGANGISITAVRAENVDFSIPYTASAQVLLGRSDENRYKGPDDFKATESLVIGTQPGTTNYEAALKLVGGNRIREFNQFELAVDALISGGVDAVMIDHVAGSVYVNASNSRLRIIGTTVNSEELGFVFAKGSPLTNAINWALRMMQEDGELDRLAFRWF